MDIINKPSGAMMLFVLLGVCCFFFWVLTRAGKVSEQAEIDSEDEESEEAQTEEAEAEDGYEEEEEEEEPVQIDPGIKFVGKGYLAAVALIALGVCLISGFQAMFPGH